MPDLITKIQCVEDLTAFLQSVNAGDDYRGESVELTTDIQLSGIGDWPGIGTAEYPFAGRFYGEGHRISGLRFDTETREVSGLFGYIGAHGIVRDLTVAVEGVCINAAGGVAGYNEGEITRCAFLGNLRADEKNGELFPGPASSGLGGIAGINRGTIMNCACGEGARLLRGGANLGGMAGFNQGGAISDCQNLSDLADCETRFASTFSYICQGGLGGITGLSAEGGAIYNCVNRGAARGYQACAGIVGLCMDTDIVSCFNHGAVRAERVWGAGIAGLFERHGAARRIIAGCVNRADVTAADFAGGITSYGLESFGNAAALLATAQDYRAERDAALGAGMHLTACLNCGAVETTAKESAMGTGGIAGTNVFYLSRCVNLGAVSSRGAFAGGIAGRDFGGAADCANFGAVTADAGAGGVAGLTFRDITACYSAGAVQAVQRAGGVLGYLPDGMAEACVAACYFCAQTAGEGVRAIGGAPASREGLTIAQMSDERAKEHMPALFAKGTWRAVKDEGRYAMTPQLCDFGHLTAEEVGLPRE